MNRYIRKPELITLTGLSYSTIYRLEKRGKFPRRVRLSPNAIGWHLRLVHEWIESRLPVDADNTKNG